MGGGLKCIGIDIPRTIPVGTLHMYVAVERMSESAPSYVAMVHALYLVSSLPTFLAQYVTDVRETGSRVAKASKQLFGFEGGVLGMQVCSVVLRFSARSFVIWILDRTLPPLANLKF